MESGAVGPLDAVRILRTAGGAMFDQAVLHTQLARIEIDEEKNRLLHMLVIVLVGFGCWLCALLVAGMLMLAVFWDTPYRLAVAAALVLIHSLGAGVAWQRFKFWSARGGQLFATSRQELAADAAVLRGGA